MGFIPFYYLIRILGIAMELFRYFAIFAGGGGAFLAFCYYFRTEVMLRVVLMLIAFAISLFFFLIEIKKSRNKALDAIDTITEKGAYSARTSLSIARGYFSSLGSPTSIMDARKRLPVFGIPEFKKLIILLFNTKNLISVIIGIVIVILLNIYTIHIFNPFYDNTLRNVDNLVQIQSKNYFLQGTQAEVFFRFMPGAPGLEKILYKWENQKDFTELNIDNWGEVAMFKPYSTGGILKGVTFSEPFLRNSVTISFLFRDKLHYHQSRSFKIYALDSKIFENIEYRILPPPGFSGDKAWENSPIAHGHYGSLVEFRVFSKEDVISPEEVPLTRNGTHFIYRTRLTGIQPRVVHFKVNLQDNEAFSTPFEFYYKDDHPPEIELRFSEKSIFIPREGKLKLGLNAKDDYGISHIRYYLVDKEDILDSGWIVPPNGKSPARGIIKTLEIPVKIFPDRRGARLILEVTDFNQRLFRHPYLKAILPGQSSFAEGPFISYRPEEESPPDKEFSSTADKNETESRDNSILSETREILTRFEESEREKNQLWKRRQKKDKLDAQEWADWLAKRKEIQRMASRSIQKMEQSGEGPEDADYKKDVTNTLKEIRDENLEKLEKDIKKLMEEFPEDFETSSQEIKKMDKDEYTAALRNTLNILREKKQQKIYRRAMAALDQEKKRLRDDMDKHGAFNPNQHREEISRIKESLQKEAKEHGLDEKKFLPPEGAWEQWKKNSDGENGKNPTGNFRFMDAWQENLRKGMESDLQNKMSEEMRFLQNSAYLLNNQSILLDSIDFSANNPQLPAQIATLEKNIVYHIQLALASPSALRHFTGLERETIKKPLEETAAAKMAIHNNHHYTLLYLKNRLRWKLNRASGVLLKRNESLQKRMAAMESGQMSQMMRDAAMTMKELNRQYNGRKNNQAGNSSAEEKEYMEYLREKIKLLRENMESSQKRNSKSPNGREVNQKTREIIKQMEQREKNHQPYPEPFLDSILQHSESIHKKEESREWKSQTAENYDLLPYTGDPELPRKENYYHEKAARNPAHYRMYKKALEELLPEK